MSDNFVTFNTRIQGYTEFYKYHNNSNFFMKEIPRPESRLHNQLITVNRANDKDLVKFTW